jgi:hypothetical protein
VDNNTKRRNTSQGAKMTAPTAASDCHARVNVAVSSPTKKLGVMQCMCDVWQAPPKIYLKKGGGGDK